jgi:hypothetical protein
MISIILPTRGLVFTEVVDAIGKNLEGVDHKVYYSTNLPIPDGHNELVEKALKDNPTHLLFIEEDTVMPDGGFKRMLDANADIVCIDYGVEGWGCVAKNVEQEILWCGLGCTLVKREVFEKLDKPYFRTDILLRLNDMQWIPAGVHETYGGQDIYFCCQAKGKGFKIVQVDGECKHLKLERLGTKEVNHGIHIIGLKPNITKHQII